MLGQHRYAECGELGPELAFQLLDRVFEVDACCGNFLLDERRTLLQIAPNVAHDRPPAQLPMMQFSHRQCRVENTPPSDSGAQPHRRELQQSDTNPWYCELSEVVRPCVGPTRRRHAHSRSPRLCPKPSLRRSTGRCPTRVQSHGSYRSRAMSAWGHERSLHDYRSASAPHCGEWSMCLPPLSTLTFSPGVHVNYAETVLPMPTGYRSLKISPLSLVDRASRLLSKVAALGGLRCWIRRLYSAAGTF